MKKIILFFAGFLFLSKNIAAWNWPWKKIISVDEKQLELQRKQIDDPTNPYINYNIGVAAYKKKQYAVASSSFDRAIQNAPDKTSFKIQAHFNLGQAHYHQALEMVGASWQTAKLSDETIDKAIEQTVRSIKEFEAVLVLESEHAHAKKMKSEVELFQQKLLAKKYENKEKKDQKNNPDKNKQSNGQSGENEQPQGDSNQKNDSNNGNQNNKQNQNNQADKSQDQQGTKQNDGNDDNQNPSKQTGDEKEGNQKDKGQQSANQNGPVEDKKQNDSGQDKHQRSQDPNDAKADGKLDEKKKDSGKQDPGQAGAGKKHDDKKDEQEHQEMTEQPASQEEAPSSDVMQHALDAHAKSVLDAVEQAEGNAQKRAMAVELSKIRQAGVGGNQKPW